MRQDSQCDCLLLVALLGALRVHRQKKLAEMMRHRIGQMFPQHSEVQVAAAVLMANTYSLLGEVEKATDVKIEMHRSGMKKKAGESWTTAEGQFYVSKTLRDVDDDDHISLVACMFSDSKPTIGPILDRPRSTPSSSGCRPSCYKMVMNMTEAGSPDRWRPTRPWSPCCADTASAWRSLGSSW